MRRRSLLRRRRCNNVDDDDGDDDGDDTVDACDIAVDALVVASPPDVAGCATMTRARSNANIAICG